MEQIAKNIIDCKTKLPTNVSLVAVSKTKPVTDLKEAYEAGQRIFGENKIQEMTDKWEVLPKDIQWHMIGHVQTNKVKYMAPYVHLIHAVDSHKLLNEINKQAKQNNRIINCLLQMKIAEEDSKFGLSEEDLRLLLQDKKLATYNHVSIIGLMGMATFTDNEAQISNEFEKLQKVYNELKNEHQFEVLSMGMSGDYKVAIQKGSTMVRIGSSIFGERN